MAVVQLIDSRKRDLGGFVVRRVLPAGTRLMVGPFIFFDHLGPTRFQPGEGIDVRPHPHIALATVTYLFAGSLLHRDSLGSVQEIKPGDVNWMSAGEGIVHSERTPPESRPQGPHIHGIQSWVALPDGQEEGEASFAHTAAAALPHLKLGEVSSVGDCRPRLRGEIAGSGALADAVRRRSTAATSDARDTAGVRGAGRVRGRRSTEHRRDPIGTRVSSRSWRPGLPFRYAP